MRIIVHFSRIITGLTFIFSGFVKGIDPWGSAYKFSDYFVAMNLDWFLWAAFPLGVILAFAEFAIGVGLLFRLFYKNCTRLALLFMLFFTGLTLWIALKNPVTDCGCFGDALILTNWQTFYKNLVLITLAVIIYLYRDKIAKLKLNRLNIVGGSASVIVYFILAIYSYNHLPIFDFRPYKIGVHIPDAMSVPAGAPQDVYENIFYYENLKTGKVKQFTQENYPWQDTLNWRYHDVESKLVSKGYEPPIHDFTIETEDGENIVDFFLYDESFTFMLVAYDLDKANKKSNRKISELASWADKEGFSFIGLTSTQLDRAESYLSDIDAPIEFFGCDEITLKTIIRSNPGLMVIKGGTIIAKYHYNDIPSSEHFKQKFIN